MSGPRAKLTARAMNWATDGLQHFDTSVSAVAEQLGVSWRTIWRGIRAEAALRIADTDRLKGVDVVGSGRRYSYVFPSSMNDAMAPSYPDARKRHR